MSRGYPSMTALLGLLAIAGYQNRDKIAEMQFQLRTEMIAKAFDDAWAQLQVDEAAEPAMASLVRTALAKRIIVQ